MRPNWFVGIPVPDAALLSDLPEAPGAVSLFDPEDLHITVAFLGAVDASAARAAFALGAAFRCPVHEAELGAVHPMGPRKRPSALSFWLAVGRAEVADAIGGVRDAMLERAGARPERRPPLPHLTVGRIRRRATRPEREAALRWAEAIDVGPRRVVLEPLALYTWAEERGHRRFRIVEQADADDYST